MPPSDVPTDAPTRAEDERRLAAATFVELQDLNARGAPATSSRCATPTPDPLAAVTWAELRTLSEALALALRELGVGRGDAVGLHMVNRSEHAIADAAALRAGATPVSFYYTLTEDQLAYVAQDCRTKVAFVDEALLPMWKGLREQARPRRAGRGRRGRRRSTARSPSSRCSPAGKELLAAGP